MRIFPVLLAFKDQFIQRLTSGTVKSLLSPIEIDLDLLSGENFNGEDTLYICGVFGPS